MSVCIIVRSGIIATGSDVTPDALNWNNITSYIATGTTNTLNVTGIDTPITLRATWTTSGDDVSGRWIKNGVSQSESDSPLDVSVINNNTLAFSISLDSPVGEVGAASGTVTVTNSSDGGAAIDTFTYYVERTGS